MSDADAARTTRPMLRIDRARLAQSIEDIEDGANALVLAALDLAGYSGGGRASPVT